MSKALIIQSGGPTAVINYALAGVVKTLSCYPKQVTQILGSQYGLHGLLSESFYDLTSLSESSLWRVAASPGAALGSARIKPRLQDLERIFSVLAAHEIRMIFYIGGNDSAEAALLIDKAAREFRYELGIMHIPKTIDNDLMETDHCPGFGSAARTLCHILCGDDLDNQSFLNGIKINIAMGRHAGWLAASAALARYTNPTLPPHEQGPHLIYLPEMRFNQDQFLQDVQTVYDRIGRVTLVVAEGIADQLERTHHGLVGEKDEFGNAQLSGSGKLSDYLVKIVKKHLKISATLGPLRVRGDTLGYVQRSLPGMQSEVDQKESFQLGEAAVHGLLQGRWNAQMVTLLRQNLEHYECKIGSCPLESVAQRTRLLPDAYVNSQGNDVTAAFLDYLRPLVGNLAEVGHIKAPLLPKRLADFTRVG